MVNLIKFVILICYCIDLYV